MTEPEDTAEPIENVKLPDVYQRLFPLNTDSPHAANLLNTNEYVRFYLADMSGLKANEVAALLPIVTAEMERRQVVPVFVTDLLDYRVFREAGVIFEAIPPEFESSALMPEKDWQARRQDVLRLIREKWKPAGETDFRADGPVDSDTL